MVRGKTQMEGWDVASKPKPFILGQAFPLHDDTTNA